MDGGARLWMAVGGRGRLWTPLVLAGELPLLGVGCQHADSAAHQFDHRINPGTTLDEVIESQGSRGCNRPQYGHRVATVPRLMRWLSHGP